MKAAEKLALGTDLAKRLAGIEVEYVVIEKMWFWGGASSTPKYRKGKVVGHQPDGTVVMERPAGSELPYPPPANAVITAKLTPGSTYDATEPTDVSPVPLAPKRPLMFRFPHKCRRCGSPAQEIFRTVDCSSWRCDNWYLR